MIIRFFFFFFLSFLSFEKLNLKYVVEDFVQFIHSWINMIEARSCRSRVCRYYIMLNYSIACQHVVSISNGFNHSKQYEVSLAYASLLYASNSIANNLYENQSL